jgi:hypothetical protein
VALAIDKLEHDKGTTELKHCHWAEAQVAPLMRSSSKQGPKPTVSRAIDKQPPPLRQQLQARAQWAQ